MGIKVVGWEREEEDMVWDDGTNEMEGVLGV